MTFSRRDALTHTGAAVVGAAVALGAHRAKEQLDTSSPLPIYGSAVSGIVPDRSAPGAASTRIVWHADTDARQVALTFDDGPHPEWTPRVLAALATTRTPATFFCVGRNVLDHSGIHATSLAAGHELANHTQTHHDLGRLDLDHCREEIHGAQEVIRTTYGVAPTVFRPPYGHLGGAAVLAAAEAGLTTVLWSAQAKEDIAATRPDSIVEQIATDVHPGAVVLAHDTGSADRLVTIDRLAEIVRRLDRDGWELVTVSSLLTTARPPS